MIQYLKIANKGLLDPRLISLMGGTTKTGNDYKIGRFGSGLKYSLAWLVRNNIDFKIFIGEKEIKVEAKTESISGTDFQVLHIDGERTSISASTGADWKGWMVCREVFCNAIDEGEYEKQVTEELIGREGWTTFYLQVTDEIKETVDDWNHYFLTGISPIYETQEFSVYPSQGKFAIYKQGILIHEDKEQKSVFTYDLKKAVINELREYKGTIHYDIFNIIRQLNKKCIDILLHNLQDGDDDLFEHSLDYDWHMEMGDQWKEALGQARIIAKEDFASFESRGVEIDKAGLIRMPQSLFKKLSSRFENISAVRVADKVSSFYEVFDSETQLAISKASIILEEAGYELPHELKFIYGAFGDPTVWAKVSQDKKTVMFSTELKRKSTFEVVTTIVEECEHFRTGFADCSRPYQQHFINLYVKQMLDKAKIEL